jgi:hypothetical protein
MGGHVVRIGEKRNAHRILDGMVWIGLIWLRERDQWKALVNTVVNLRVP